LLLTACGGEPQQPKTPPPRTVDLSAIADADLVAAVLDECHRPLRGRLDRIAAIVHLPDGEEVRLFAQLPDKLRAVARDGSFLLLQDDVHRLHADRTEPAAPADAARIRLLRTLLDAALLGPLHRARDCHRVEATEWDVRQPDGSSVRLALRPHTLLPARLTDARGDVRFDDYLRTSTTWMVQRAALDGLGACRLQFLLHDMAWAPDFFDVRPLAAATPSDAAVRMPTTGGEPQSPDAFLVDSAAARWIVVADPGTWPLRCERYAPLHEELVRQGQQVAGFPVLWQEGGEPRLAAPFRQKRGGAEFAPPSGWTIRDVPGGRWLVVYPPEGDLAARLADGERRLQEAATARRLTARGPVIAQPFFHLQEGVPPADKLAAPVVRMSLPVQ
jgi:hypothetical protein